MVLGMSQDQKQPEDRVDPRIREWLNGYGQFVVLGVVAVLTVVFVYSLIAR